MIYRITRATKHLLLWSLVALAVSLSLVRFSLLSVADYKADLEDKIHELTSIPIKIGMLRANMRGFSPEIILKGIQVLPLEGKAKSSIQLEEVRLGIDLVQLLLTRQLLPSSWLTLVGVKLSVVRQQDGSLSIVGLNSEDSKQPLWLIQGGRYEVLKSDITWLDKQRHAQPITFNNVDLLIKNDSNAQTHEIHLVSQLPEQYGQALRVSMAIQGNPFEADSIDGSVYVEGSDIHLAKLLTGDMPLGMEISTGDGDFKLWSQWKSSQLQSLSGHIKAKNIVLHKDQNTFEINKLNTNFTSVNQDGWKQFGVSDFSITTATHQWPTAEFMLSANDSFTQLSASITQLDLQESTELLHFFAPLDEHKQQLISGLALKGMLKDFTIYMDSEKNTYAVNGNFSGVSTNAFSVLPKIENLTGSLKGTQSSGRLAFNTKNGSVFFPEVFKQAHSIKQLQGLVTWQQTTDQWLLATEQLVIENADIQTQTKLALTIPKNDQAVFIDLQTSFSNMHNISSAANYYPVDAMDKDLVDWLEMALVSGKVVDGKALIYGNLDRLPFVDDQGVFEVLFNVEDVKLKYAPDWPVLNNFNAEVLFSKDSLKVDVAHADAKQMAIKRTLVEIPAFEKSNYVSVTGQTEGSIVAVLDFLKETPLHPTIDDILETISPEGLTQVDVDLKIPLVDGISEKVDGVAHFKEAALIVKTVDLNVVDVTGDLKFTENGVFSKNIKAKALGYPIDITVDNKRASTAINIEGKTNVFQLKQQFSFLRHDFIKAEQENDLTRYKINLDLPAEESKPAKLNVKTNLLGIAIDLPASLKKSAKQKKSLDLNLLLDDQTLLPLTMKYGRELNAAVEINKQQSNIYSADIVYGKKLAVMQKNKGIKIQIERDTFDASKWMGVVASKKAAESELNAISLKTKQLQWKGKSYGAIDIAMHRSKKQWAGHVFSSVAKGQFILPFTDNDAIILDMKSISLSELMRFKSQGKQVSISDFPLIQVKSEQLWWNNTNVGQLAIKAEKLEEGVRFNNISIVSDTLKLELKADWLKTDKGHVTEVYGEVVAEDVGEFLSELDITNDLKETKANLGFFGSWSGSPSQFSLAGVHAEMDLELNNGRISSIEPGFGRILGLLAMEQWLKRLTLDFRDIYKQGLSFNSIKGHLKMRAGKLTTKDLRVDAIPARISIIGEADLQAKTLDHLIQVVPKSAGAVPIAGTIVSGIAGAITEVLTNNYKEGYFFGSTYKVTGQWDDITVTPLHDQDGIFKKTWTDLTDFSWTETLTE
ncbi:MAG: TIGR02099 family protein [Methylomarinum sp.]|nr:TIGR02099 family protein [Methylomarinum sp.]